MNATSESAAAKLVALIAEDGPATRVEAVRYWRGLPAAASRRMASGGPFVRSLMTFIDAGALAGACSIAGMEGRFAARDAAFANGALMAAEASLPVAAIVAVVAALTEEMEGDEETAVAAVGFGLDVLDRLECAAGAGVRARGHLAEGLLGAPAVTAAAGRAIGLSQSALVDALGIAGSTASGSREWRGEDAALLAGWMARSAVLAVRLAQTGFSGPAEVFEGRKGLFNAYAGPGGYTMAALSEAAPDRLLHRRPA